MATSSSSQGTAVQEAVMSDDPDMDELPVLDDYQRNELANWLNYQDIDIDELDTVCSDAVLLAKLMKALFPHLLELDDYKPSKNLTQRMQNWERLNVQVFCPTGLPQSRQMLQLYINNSQDALELLLFDIMELAETERIKRLADTECERRQRMRFYRDDSGKQNKMLQMFNGHLIEVTKRFLPCCGQSKKQSPPAIGPAEQSKNDDDDDDDEMDEQELAKVKELVSDLAQKLQGNLPKIPKTSTKRKSKRTH